MSEPRKRIHKDRDAKLLILGDRYKDQINKEFNDQLQAHGAIKQLTKKLKKLGY